MSWQEQAHLNAGLVVVGDSALPLVGRARVYSCGITPYDVAHLGHADRAGEPYDRFAAIQEFYFGQDMTSLRIAEPSVQPRAHAHIGEVVALAAGLLARDMAYERAGSVYFRGGPAARKAVADEAVALRLAAEYGDDPQDPDKDDPLDVAIWRAARPGLPAWDSPWGAGRPGWHAECAAIALDAFGSSVDVLAGGRDLRFPHHFYQAALAEALTAVTPFARTTVNVGVVRIGDQKMAKSAGNLILVRDLLAAYPAAAVRLLLLDRPWEQDWSYEPAALDAAAARMERLHSSAGRACEVSLEAAEAQIGSALRANLNVPAALDVAEDAGGQPARALISLLGLW